jgi:hypothetical protein
MSPFFCVKFKFKYILYYLGSYFVPELSDTADISTERISQAGRQARESMVYVQRHDHQ